MDRPAAWRENAVDLEAERPFRIGGATVDPISREATYEAGHERLQPQTLKVLIALKRRNGEVVTRSELIDGCWGGRIVGEDVINRSVSILRDFAGRVGGFTIETIPKAGYRLVDAEPKAANLKRYWVLGPTAVLIAAGAVGSIVALRTAPVLPKHELEVRLAGFTGLSPGVEPGLLKSMSDETFAAFADDGAIGLTTGVPHRTENGGNYQLGGSVQRDAAGYKVILRIENAGTGASLWSRAFDYGGNDRDKVARLVALNIANMARCAFGRSITYPRKMPDETLRLLFGVCENDGTLNWELDRAIDYARRVTIASPDFSMGWSGIAGVAVMLRRQKPPAEAASIDLEAREALNSALRIDRQNGEAWALRSYFIQPGELAEREASLKQATKARPLDCGCEHYAYGLFLSEVGRLKEAEREFKRGVDIMHLNDGLYADLARAQFALGHRAEAFGTLASGKRISRDPDDLELIEAEFAIRTGDYLKAIEILRTHQLANPNRAAFSRLANALRSNHTDEAREILISLTRDPATNGMLPISLLATLGDTEGALSAVESLALKNPPLAHRVLLDPGLSAAQDDQAFWATARKLGLVSYWRNSRQLPDLCRRRTVPEPCLQLQGRA